MGIFKSQAEKDAAKQAKMKKWLNERGLNGVDADNFQQVNRIKSSLWGTGILGAFADKNEVARNSMYLIQALTEQNWLIIKQNDKLAKQNDEIIKLLKEGK
ncbi:hypothetical protein [Liquorilactobacillus uvarum]|uniref:hypothetical protein n=1 Tax=Liquorilactobacillus uvarum TaxID=303240 RepID=UPI00288BCE52|nr:hypothetical protein [Liquorilactobacillus uvarum]